MAVWKGETELPMASRGVELAGQETVVGICRMGEAGACH